MITRTVIIGNSGSGKSTLAAAIASLTGVPAFDLDLFHWEEGSYGQKRNEDVARQMVLDVAGQPHWIIEGVFGWLAELVLAQATTLIWLDCPWSVCRAGLLDRGRRRGASPQDAAELMTWAEAYWTRQTPSSFAGHARIFGAFAGTRLRFESRDQAARFLEHLRAGAPSTATA